MAQSALLVLAAGEDRPGIVDRVSGAVFAEKANLQDSRMAVLGGEFALMVLVTGDAATLAAVRRSLEALGAELELTVQCKETTAQAGTPGSAARYRVRAVSLDHPGIVHKISRVLSARGVNVRDLQTEVECAPTTGSPMFTLTLAADLPGNVSAAEVEEALDGVAREEDLDVTLERAD